MSGRSTGGEPRRGRGEAVRTPPDETLGELLARARGGDPTANRLLFEALYQNLRAVARGVMRREPAGCTLDPTALVHEAFLRLTGSAVPWVDQRHFFSVAARAMRRILVDRARSRRRRRAGTTARGEAASPVLVEYENRAIDVLALDEALDQLAAEDARAASVVELRFFGGLSLVQVARTIGVPLRTAERDWQWARAFLYARLT